jgi:hypothetical protein
VAFVSIYVMAPVLRATLPDIPGTPDHPGTTGQTLKLVALALADSANEDGTGARPGVRTAALFAQVHTSTVVRALAYLVELGAVTLTDPGGPGRCATYTVHVGWFHEQIDRPRDRRSCPPSRAPYAQGARAPHAREARAPDAREARAPDARSYVPPSVTSRGAADDAADIAPPSPERAAAIWRRARDAARGDRRRRYGGPLDQ